MISRSAVGRGCWENAAEHTSVTAAAMIDLCIAVPPQALEFMWHCSGLLLNTPTRRIGAPRYARAVSRSCAVPGRREGSAVASAAFPGREQFPDVVERFGR